MCGIVGDMIDIGASAYGAISESGERAANAARMKTASLDKAQSELIRGMRENQAAGRAAGNLQAEAEGARKRYDYERELRRLEQLEQSGRRKANVAAKSGVRVDTGSPVQVEASDRLKRELEEKKLGYDAELEAWKLESRAGEILSRAGAGYQDSLLKAMRPDDSCLSELSRAESSLVKGAAGTARKTLNLTKSLLSS